MTEASPPRPQNAVVVLLDSLNRHLLGSYGSAEFDTPNLDRLAGRSVRFTRHFAGSLPCMPARHDILVGALDFLWRPWGSIEVWEDSVTYELRKAGVTTMLVSDHPHLFETGGENYHTDFTAWEYLRGHESDPWKTRPDPSWVGTPALPAATAEVERAYDVSRTWFRSEEDYPGPKTMRAAADWLEVNAGHHDRFLLFVDEFDPHEPFDTPEPWASRYDPGWTEPRIIWPPYDAAAVRHGRLTEDEALHVRANYGAKLSMIDHWFGRILDAFDRLELWSDTALVVCTDHGHYLGEKDIFGKPRVMLYEPLVHTPLFVSWPGVEPGTVDALTTNVDLHATLCDLYGVEVAHRTHGRSLAPLIDGTATEIRDWALAGIWAGEVHVIDGHRKYARAAAGDNAPLSLWSNRWSSMPVPFLPELRLPPPDTRAYLDAMPGTDVPVIRQPYATVEELPWMGRMGRQRGSHAFDLDEDPTEDHDLAGTAVEKELEELLRTALADVEAPDDHYVRLGLT